MFYLKKELSNQKIYSIYTYYNKYESNVGTTAHCIASKANEKMF